MEQREHWKMKWHYRKIVVASAMMLSGMFSSETVAEELSSEAKIKIIEEIVETKLKEAKGGDAKSDVLDAVAAKFPLDPTDTPEYLSFVKQLEEQTRKKYPVTDKELNAKYTAMAEKFYPLYKAGDNVTVGYLLAGKPFTVSGTFYRLDSNFVWVGSKKISRRSLDKDYALRFDSVQVKQVRRNYVKVKVLVYQQERNSYLENLKSRNTDRIHILRGDIQYEKKWSTARAIALQKYTSAAERQDKLIAESIQKAQDCSDYNEKYKSLEGVIRQYPNHRSVSSIENLLQGMRGEKKRKNEIRQQLQGIWQLQFSEKRPQWQSISKSYYAVDLALSKARGLQGEALYDQAIAEVEKIISQEPRISAVAGAQNLLQTLKQQREEVRQEQRRLAESRAAVQKIRFNDPNQTAQIVVRKQVNPENNCAIWIFPEDRRNDILELHRNLENMLESMSIYKNSMKKYEQGDQELQSAERLYGTTSYTVNLRRQNINRFKDANIYMARAGAFRRNAETVISQELQNKTMNGAVFTGSCNLSNIRGPVIIFAFEKLTNYSGFKDVYQSWYLEYTPTSQTVDWNLK